VDHLNVYLKIEGLELRSDGKRHRLYDMAGTTAAVDEAQRVVDLLDFDGCKREFDRALTNLDNDPAASITAACSALESIAKTILLRLGEPIPSQQDVSKLVYAALARFKLVPDQQDDQDVKRVLGGLLNVVGSIGAFRTKLGTAHGRGDGHADPDRHMAELCVNSSSAVALFLLHQYAATSGKTTA
jgi:hypothetical protein